MPVSVAAHLGIDPDAYDRGIRTFIPRYSEMIRLVGRAVGAAVTGRAPTILDLGIGTGALSAECRKAKPHARLVGIDEDEEMLAAARARLGKHPRLLLGNFERLDFPPCHAIIASLALHHIPTLARRIRLFRRCAESLRRNGVVVSGDCYLSAIPALQAAERREWLTFLERRYTPPQARAYLRAWAREDFYVTLGEELSLLQRTGFRTDVAGRWGCFAVIVGTRCV